MEISKLPFIDTVQKPGLLTQLKSASTGADGEVGAAGDAQKKQLAKDFESLLVGKVIDQMKETVGDWGFEEDGAGEQVRGLFWLYLARDVGEKGGFGLWKDIYRFFKDIEQVQDSKQSLDKNV